MRQRAGVPITAISEPAWRVLSAAGRGGVRVVARFDSTVSLAASGLLVSVSERPVHMVCQAQVDAAGMRLLRRMRIGDAVGVDLSHCAPALPMCLEPSTRSLVTAAGGLERPPSWFDRPDAAPGVLGRLHDAATALVADPGSVGTPATAVPDMRPVERLMGLGIGLTPSGDDALVGMLAALWAERGRTRGVDAVARLVDRRPPLTTEASLTYLRLACGGEFSRPVLDLVQALRQRSGVHHAVQHVAHIGHSSGADLLAGLAVAIEMLGSPGRPPRPPGDNPAPLPPTKD